MAWLAFFLSLLVLLGLARRSIWLSMFAGALVLGFFLLPLAELPKTILSSLSDPGAIALIFAVGLIPLIGALLEEGGWLSYLLGLIPGGRRMVFLLAPALFGLLPVPGGALLSAPILEKVGGGRPEERAAANVWFRHILLFFYPMSSALIAGAKLAGLDLWTIIPYQLLWAAFAVLLGFPFLLRPFRGPKANVDHVSLKALFPLAVLLSAPLLDFLLKRVAPLPALEVATLLALFFSFFLALLGSRLFGELLNLIKKAAPWRFSLIVCGMFVYLGVFRASGLPEVFASLNFPLFGLILGLGLLMGLATGRQQAAISVTIPIHLAARGSLDPFSFSVIYQAAYLGYLLSPLHPCLVVSAEYAKADLWKTWGKLFPPSLAFLFGVVLAGIFLYA
ncbi:DUF401 family protein [Candidatus Bipolaricaulota bacterium]|nr:DUF401 family protein [Candidatus Bipolaricaulota bacterium]